MAAFAEAALEDFEANLIAYLESAFPEKFPGAADTNDHPAAAFVKEGIQTAKKYQITVERDITDFVRLMVFFGKDFQNTEPMGWTKRFLEDDELPGPSRIRLIVSDLTDGEHQDLLPKDWNRGN